MFQRSDLLVRLATAVAVVFLSCAVAGAAELGETSPIVQTAVNSTDLSWQPTIGFESAVLVVSGPGDFVLRKEFTAGESLALGVIDKRGEALADGQYAWELRFSPKLDSEVKETLRASRESGPTPS